MLLGFGIALRVFYNRPPILIIMDIPFSALYGPERLERQSRCISLTFFRRVILVPVDESAAPELMALAVQDVFVSPWAVVFPYRYLEGARRYKEAIPGTLVLVVGGTGQSNAEDFSLVLTDTHTDLYRAGMAAALFTGEKRPLFLSDGYLSDELREVFLQGLVDNGSLSEPVFMYASSAYPSWPEIGCVVVAGPAAAFAEQNLDIPVILFSWIDPSLTPGTVKLVFDDSHMTLALEALKAPPAQEILLPSSLSIFGDRIGEKAVYSELKDLIRKK